MLGEAFLLRGSSGILERERTNESKEERISATCVATRLRV